MKRKRRVQKPCSLFATAALLIPIILYLVPLSASAADKPIELRMTTVVTSLHPNFKASEKYVDEVNKKTGGRVHITLYPAGTLNPAMETYNAVKTGMAQMGAAPVGYSPSIMPLNKLVGDALRGPASSSEATKAYEAALKALPELSGELEGIHLLWVGATLPLSIGTAKKPIRKMEDFQGLVMRFPPGLEPLAKAWGISPISVPVGDIYVALQKGTIQGYFGGSEMLQAMRLAELTKYVTSVGMVYGISWTGMNKKTWDSLPPDIQKVFTDLNEFGQDLSTQYTDASEKAAIDFAKSQGTQIINIEKGELERLHAAAKPVFEKMAADLEGRGKPGKKVLAEVERLSKK